MSSICRYVKIPDRDSWVPCYVVKKDELNAGLYVVVELGYSTIASKLLGDNISYHSIVNRHYVGAWIHQSYKTSWRTTPSTVPTGKALLVNNPLNESDLTEELVETIPVLTEVLPAPTKPVSEGVTVAIQSDGVQVGVPELNQVPTGTQQGLQNEAVHPYPASIPDGTLPQQQALGGQLPDQQSVIGQFAGNLPPQQALNGQFGGQFPPQQALNGQFGGQFPPLQALNGQFGGQFPPLQALNGQFGGQFPPLQALNGQFDGQLPSPQPLNGSFASYLPLQQGQVDQVGGQLPPQQPLVGQFGNIAFSQQDVPTQLNGQLPLQQVPSGQASSSLPHHQLSNVLPQHHQGNPQLPVGPSSSASHAHEGPNIIYNNQSSPTNLPVQSVQSLLPVRSSSTVIYPKFAPVLYGNDFVDAVTKQRAKQDAKDATIPDSKVFSGVDDSRPVVNIIKSANRLSSTNGWGAIEYYFYLARCLDESVANEINLTPQITHSAYAQEVHRICQALCVIYHPTETEYIRNLYAWNSLVMADKQGLGEYLKVFNNLRLEIERCQGYQFNDKLLSSKLVMSLKGQHHEAALSRMKTLSYRDLMQELLELDKLRNLSAQHRQKLAGVDSSRHSRPADALPKLPVNVVTTSTTSKTESTATSSGPSSVTPNPSSSSTAPSKQAHGTGKGRRRYKRFVKCPRCLDREERCQGDVTTCPAAAPVDKQGRCPHCNRLSTKCSPPCSKAEVLCTRGCGAKHHPAHFPKAPSRSAETSALAFQQLTFNGGTPPHYYACSMELDGSLALNLTKVSLSDLPSPLRNAEFAFATVDGKQATFEGLMDTGCMLLAMSDIGLNKLRMANVSLLPTGRVCTATLAVNKKVSSCPIFEITYVHRSQKVDTFIALVPGLNRDFIWSSEVFRRLTEPVLWVFHNAGDRLISLVDASCEVSKAFNDLLEAVRKPTSPPASSAPLCNVEIVDSQTVQTSLDDPQLAKDFLSDPFTVDDLPIDPDGDLTLGCHNITFSGEFPVVTLSPLTLDGPREDASAVVSPNSKAECDTTVAKVPLQGTSPVVSPNSKAESDTTVAKVPLQGTSPVVSPNSKAECDTTVAKVPLQGTSPVVSPNSKAESDTTVAKVPLQGTSPVVSPNSKAESDTTVAKVPLQGTSPVVSQKPKTTYDKSAPQRFSYRLRWITSSRPTNSPGPFIKRASSLEHQLRRKGHYDLYNDQLKAFEAAGYIKKVNKRQIQFWLNHFPIYKDKSSTTTSKPYPVAAPNRSSMAVRPVFDGSTLSPYIDASLPPGLSQGVVQSLSFLRRYHYFWCLDLVQAFLQVEIELLQDQLTLGFWWCGQAYCFLRCCFGVPDSPFALADSLLDVLTPFPAAAYRILMDDIQLGADIPQELRQLRQHLLSRLQCRMMSTNPKKDLSTLPECHPSGSYPLLGLLWCADDDTFIVGSNLRHKASDCTHLQKLKCYANCLFDPLGWFLEWSMCLRIICRNARSGAEPQTGRLRLADFEALSKWEERFTSQQRSVPRLLRSSDELCHGRATNKEASDAYASSLCLLTDSSDIAGAGILYTLYGRRVAAHGYVHAVQGINRRTAPRYELDALAAAMDWVCDYLREIQNHSPTSTLLVFTDSTISIARLRQSTPLVAYSVDDLVTVRRIIRIKNAMRRLQQYCTGIQIFISHISGKYNLADAPSRGLLPNGSIDVDALFMNVRNYQDSLLRSNDFDLDTLPHLYRLPPSYQVLDPPSTVTKKISTTRTTSDSQPDDHQPIISVSAVEMEGPSAPDKLMFHYYLFKLLVKVWLLWTTQASIEAQHIADLFTPLHLLIRQEQQSCGMASTHGHQPFHTVDEDGCIYRTSRQSADGTLYRQLVLPKQAHLLQRLTVYRSHDSHHEAVQGTLSRLVRGYAWPNMRLTTRMVCSTCSKCKLAKPQRRVAVPANSFVMPQRVWQYIGLDHTGPYDLPAHDRSFPYCLVATCLLSGYQLAIPTPSTSLPHTLVATKKIFSLGGIPKGIRCDNHAVFKSAMFRTLILSYSVRLSFIPPGAPQRGGAYERQHAALNEQLRILQFKDQPWEVTVFEATALSNARIRWSTSLSSSTTPWDLAHSYPFVQAGMSSAQDLLPSARVADFLLHQWEEGREKTRRQCGDKPHNFKPGSITYVVKSKRPTKLGSQVSGPYRILWVAGNTAYLQSTLGHNRTVFQQPIDNLVRPGPVSSKAASPLVSDASCGPPDPVSPSAVSLDDQAKAASPTPTTSSSVATDDSVQVTPPSSSLNTDSSSSPKKPPPKTTRAVREYRRVGDPLSPSSHCNNDFGYVKVRGKLLCGKIVDNDNGVFRLQLAHREGPNLNLTDDYVSSSDVRLLRVQDSTDDRSVKLSRASVRLLNRM